MQVSEAVQSRSVQVCPSRFLFCLQKKFRVFCCFFAAKPCILKEAEKTAAKIRGDCHKWIYRRMKKDTEAGGMMSLREREPVRKERPKAKPKIETTAAQPVLSERDRKRHRQVWIQRIVIALVLCTILVGGVICLKIFLTPKTVNVSVPYTESAETEAAQAKVPMPDIDLQLLTVNEYSRPGLSTGTINGVVVHYTANPSSTAQQNRDYFENLKDTHTTKVSSNFVIGLEGEIIQCIPTSEIAYASNSRNTDTVSIECCHPDETGKFTDATYDSLVQLTAFLSRNLI